jgi:hypothetical protein
MQVEMQTLARPLALGLPHLLVLFEQALLDLFVEQLAGLLPQLLLLLPFSLFLTGCLLPVELLLQLLNRGLHLLLGPGVEVGAAAEVVVEVRWAGVEGRPQDGMVVGWAASFLLLLSLQEAGVV